MSARTHSRRGLSPRVALLGVLLLAALAAGGVAWGEAPAAAPAAHAAPSGGHASAGVGEGGGKSASAHESESEGARELPNWIHLTYLALGGEGEAPAWIRVLYHFEDLFFALLAAALIILVVRLGTRRMALIPGRAQAVVEMFIDGFSSFILGILGPGGKPYVPFLGTLFLYIWFMNLIGLVPLMKSPTSALSTTAALAICVFLYVQSIGIRRLGIVNYLRHLAGDPQDAIGWGMVPLMFPMHIIGELARPVSLSLRLFGNILGEDLLIGVFAGLGVAILAFLKLPIGVPLHLPFILLALLMSTVQALVFTLLSTIYIMQMLPHEEEHAPAGAHSSPGAHPVAGTHPAPAPADRT